MARELQTHRMPNTHHKPLAEDIGIYYDIIGSWCIEILEDIGELKMWFQRNRELSYWLDHYQNDVFSWLLTRNEDVHRGRFPVIHAEFYLMNFKSSDAGTSDAGTNVDQLVWRHDADVPGSEIFYKNPPTCV